MSTDPAVETATYRLADGHLYTFDQLADAQARLDEGVGTHEEQAADQVLADAYDAILSQAWDAYWLPRLAADDPHTVEFGHHPEGGWWWACTWGGEATCFDTEADARADADAHQHEPREED